MELPKFFLTASFNNAKVISRDSKIYEAFKPYLLDMQGITLEQFMNDKELRKSYCEKFLAIKAKLQKINKSGNPLSDEKCLMHISKSCREWQDFIITAKENTLDNGESFIQKNPLDSYITMTTAEKLSLEEQLISAAIERVRTFTRDTIPSSDKLELNNMITSSNDHVEEKGRKIQ